MKIKRFVAQDMRQAIRQVRESLGADAVILSNKAVEGGVELMAAIDFSPSELTENSARASTKSAPSPTSPRPAMQGRPQSASSHPAAADDSVSLANMQREMQQLRRMMFNGLSELGWNRMGEQRPANQELLRRLMAMGVSAGLARRVAEKTAVPGGDVELAWRKGLFHLANELPIAEQDLLDRGGIVALVGPTGVGKTTTIAKLAARYALKHGARHVALVTTDNFRIGARDQLHTYGRILNVPVRTAANPDEMRAVLNELANYRFILIDTAGMGCPDQRFEGQLAAVMDESLPITRLLTLSANTEAAAIERAIRMYDRQLLDGCILTKLDEAAALGGFLTAVIQNSLPVTYIADGQKVPEDLRLARAQPLVELAAELMAQYAEEMDPIYMAYAYGGTLNHARF